MSRSPSYRPASCHGEDCAYSHTDPRPCWGQVEYEDDVVDGEGNYEPAFACQGHWGASTGDSYTVEGTQIQPVVPPVIIGTATPHGVRIAFPYPVIALVDLRARLDAPPEGRIEYAVTQDGRAVEGTRKAIVWTQAPSTLVDRWLLPLDPGEYLFGITARGDATIAKGSRLTVTGFAR